VFEIKRFSNNVRIIYASNNNIANFEYPAIRDIAKRLWTNSDYYTDSINYNNNNIVRDLSWTSPSYDNNLKPTSSNIITIAASISDNGSNNSTPFLLPSPSPSQPPNNNNSSTPAVGSASNTSPSNNVVNSNSPSQGHNGTNTHHDSHSSSQTKIVSSNNNHIENQHKKHKHGSTVDIINQVVSQSKGQFTGGEIPFP
jgi:hypothetical protein